MQVLKPRQPVPDLTVDTLDGTFTLSATQAEHFVLVVFYRGLHCPICKTYVSELNRLADDFRQRGVEVIVISSDSRDRAEQAKSDWGLDNLAVGYDLAVADARAFGLHRSAGRGPTNTGIEEPDEFSEPGLFLVRADGTLYWSNISTMPFARPHFREVLGAIDFVLAKDYPARGELD